MTRSQVFKGIQEIFSDIFDEAGILIEDSTSPDDINDWDSLNHLNLIGAIEKEFKIKFTLQELTTVNNVGVITDLVMTKLR